MYQVESSPEMRVAYFTESLSCNALISTVSLEDGEPVSTCASNSHHVLYCWLLRARSIGDYLDGFFKGFDAKLRDGRLRSPRVEFMGSDGGLVDTERFSGLKSILSGPAGGVVGYALTSWDEETKTPIIGYVNYL